MFEVSIFEYSSVPSKMCSSWRTKIHMEMPMLDRLLTDRYPANIYLLKGHTQSKVVVSYHNFL